MTGPKKLLIYSALAVLALLCMLTGILYYLLWTTHGSRFVLKKVSALASEYVRIELNIKEGNLAQGFKSTGPFLVEVPEVVSVTASSLDFKWSLWDQLKTGTLTADFIKVPKLKVELAEALFDDSDPALAPIKDARDEEQAFRLNIPVKAVIRHLYAEDFAFISPVVDVFAGKADLGASCFGDYAGLRSGRLRDVNVHLKYKSEPQDQGSEDQAEILDLLLGKMGGDPGAQKTPPAKFPTIDLPLDTELRDLLIINGRYYMDGFDTGAFDAYADASWSGHILKVSNLSTANADGKAWVRGSMDFSDYFGLHFDVHAQDRPLPQSLLFLKDHLPEVDATARIEGSLADLKGDLKLLTPKKARINARINVLDSLLPFELKVDSQDLSYPWYLTKAKVQGGYDDSTSLMSADKSIKDPRSANELKAHSESLEKTASAHDAFGINMPKLGAGIFLSDLSISVRGEIFGHKILDGSAVLNGFNFNDLKLSLFADSVYDEKHPDRISADGKYLSSNFKAELSGQIFSGLDSVQAFVNETVPKLQSLFVQENGEDKDESVRPASGAIDVKAQKREPFFCRVLFSADEVSGISPFVNGPMRLSASLNADYSGENSYAALEDLNFDGVIGGISAKGALRKMSFDHQNLQVSDLIFSQGDNKITADGRAGENSSVEARIALKNLNTLIPGLRGSAGGTLKVKGDAEHAALELFLRSQEIRYADVSLRGLSLNARTDEARKSGGITLFADLIRFDDKLRPSRKCTFDLFGNENRHLLTLGCAGNNSGFAALSGSYDRVSSLWRGELSDLSMITQFGQNVSLKKKTALSFDFKSKEAHFGPVTLQSNIGVLSLGGGKLENGHLRSSLRLENLNLDALSALLPENVRVRGDFTAQGDIGIENYHPFFDVDFAWDKARIFAQGAFLDFESFKGAALLQGNLMQAALDTKLRNKRGSLKGELNVRDPVGAKSLRGYLTLRDFSLDRLSGVGDGFNELTGRANADLRLSGSLHRPLLDGKLAVLGSAEPRYDIGRLNKFDLVLNASGTNGTLDGNIGVNGGSLKVHGLMDWSEGAFGKINFSADELPLFLMGYGSCFANINAEAAFGEQNSIRGTVVIPKARILVNGLGENGTVPSQDEVIIGENGGEELLKEVRRRNGLQDENLSVDLSLDLGSDVKVEAMGLKTDLQGGINFKKSLQQKDIRAEGIVSSVNGRAELYGHRFLLTYAQSVFDGNIADPKINAEVIADPSGIEDEVEAGVRVSGRARDPEIVLFSKPAMSQNEILSYLLYGHGLDKNTNDPDSSSMQLLTALGLGTTTGIVNSVAGALGVNGLQFGSSGSGQQTQIGVQTYLTNNIMMSYGYGVFTSVGEFKLRYEMMRRFYVEFVSSLDQAVDLIYSFEFD